jgi:hypothetical protein
MFWVSMHNYNKKCIIWTTNVFFILLFLFAKQHYIYFCEIALDANVIVLFSTAQNQDTSENNLQSNFEIHDVSIVP